MNRLVQKLQRVQNEIAQEKGDLVLCALVLRRTAPAAWDIVLSAYWFEKKRSKTLDYVVGKLQKTFSRKEMLAISRIVLLDPSDSFVTQITRAFVVEAGSVADLQNTRINELDIRHMYILSSRPLQPQT